MSESEKTAEKETEEFPIKKATFIEKLDDFLKDKDVEALLTSLNSDYSTYKYQERAFNQQKYTLKSKLPDIEATLNVVKFLKQSEADSETQVDFEISSGIYVKTKIQKGNAVCLWLGANVMVEYSHDEAIELLSNNLTKSTESLSRVEKNLAFLKDQITTTEVNIARVYNWDVKQRRIKKTLEKK
eukprot:TRINITY_DN8828_c0_g1_i1.p1 TRINITY_DN8828_c0_g1~~TRINITY_DN8828_c0_g1_i1.p1  ORF type:complete len:185 (+),score=39.25 TRINITY_DN8828_c0_g1_i1:53-607(+)